jgi:cytochrome c5
MAKETVQGNLPQSRQDDSIESSSEETIQDRLRSQNVALNAEVVRLQQACTKLETLLSAHTLGRGCRLCHQQQASHAPESETAIKSQSDQKRR